MIKVACFSILLVATSCSKKNDLATERLYQQISASMPNMDVSYGDIGVRFTADQIKLRIGLVGDSAISSYIFEGLNGTYSFRMEVMTDSLRTGTYMLDGHTGTVTLYQYGNIQIGALAYQPLQLDISYDCKRMMRGDFYGVLSDPGTGKISQIQGNFVNL